LFVTVFRRSQKRKSRCSCFNFLFFEKKAV